MPLCEQVCTSYNCSNCSAAGSIIRFGSREQFVNWLTLCNSSSQIKIKVNNVDRNLFGISKMTKESSTLLIHVV